MKIPVELADEIKQRRDEEEETAKRTGKASQWLKGLKKAIAMLESCPTHGTRVQRDGHGTAYAHFEQKFGLPPGGDWPLHKLDRSGWGRLSYAILSGPSAGITVFIMEYDDHNTYNRSYGYR